MWFRKERVLRKKELFIYSIRNQQGCSGSL
jgi:hypothetical protein